MESLCRVGDCTSGDVLRLYLSHRACEGTFLLDTVTYNDCFLEHLVVRFHVDVQSAVDGVLLDCEIADVKEFENSPGFDGDLVRTVSVSHDAVLSSFLDDTDSYHRSIQFINDFTGHLQLSLCGCRERAG